MNHLYDELRITKSMKKDEIIDALSSRKQEIAESDGISLGFDNSIGSPERSTFISALIEIIDFTPEFRLNDVLLLFYRAIQYEILTDNILESFKSYMKGDISAFNKIEEDSETAKSSIFLGEIYQIGVFDLKNKYKAKQYYKKALKLGNERSYEVISKLMGLDILYSNVISRLKYVIFPAVVLIISIICFLLLS